jgi:polyisoprenyl-phosphate glycosyltransferase
MTSIPNPKINIVIPLYNEESVFPILKNRLIKLLNDAPVTVEVIMVDDGSIDNTGACMEELSRADDRFQSIFLSRNFGHQLALTAGLSFINATEGVFIIDGDLQDPPELLWRFYEKLKEGYDVVYAVRAKRKEGIIKNTAYKTFYRLLKRVSYIDIPLDSGDFALLSRRVIDLLNTMPEESRFLRGMRAWVGFKQIGIEYERSERVGGDSKYTLKNLFLLAFNGLFNFSQFPIRFISLIGLATFTPAILYFIYCLIKKFYYGTVPEGFTALLFAIILFSGIQLLSIGILGEYLMRIFYQVKGRPLFIIKARVKNKQTFPG